MTKHIEVWRNADGSFAKAPEPEVPVEPQKEDGNVIIALALVGVAGITLAIEFWQFTIVALVVLAGSYGAYKYSKNKSDLIINYYN